MIPASSPRYHRGMDGFGALLAWYPNLEWLIDEGLAGKKYGIVRGQTVRVSPAVASLIHFSANLDELAFLLAHLPFRREADGPASL